MRWHSGLKWLWGIIVGLLLVGQVWGKSMQASEFFKPPMVQLLSAIQKGNESQARTLLADGLDLNIQGEEGITPLLWLIMEKDKPATQLALRLGASPNYVAGMGASAVYITAGASSPDWLEMMLNAGGDPDACDSNKVPALFAAIGEDRWDTIRLLVDRGANINLKDGPGRNSALYAAYLNKYDIVYWLLGKGADYRQYDAVGSDLAWSVEDSLSLMDTKSGRYPWAIKVKQWLVDHDVAFPPPSPAEIRSRRAAGKLN